MPVVAGQLQRPAKDEHNSREGSKYLAKIVDSQFSDDLDQVTLDLWKAYNLDVVTKLERTFQYHRGESEKVVVTDVVKYEKPSTFETALITYCDWKLEDDGALLVSDGEAAVRVTIHSEAGEFNFTDTVIEESSTPTRLSWKLKEPVSSARVTMTVVPG